VSSDNILRVLSVFDEKQSEAFSCRLRVKVMVTYGGSDRMDENGF